MYSQSPPSSPTRLNRARDSEISIISPNKMEMSYKRPGYLSGYTGYYSQNHEETSEIDSPNHKIMIRGYTGKIYFILFSLFLFDIFAYFLYLLYS